MRYRFGDVSVQAIAPLHSRVHFCREGMLVRLTGSRNTLECRRTCINGREYYHLYINGQLMLDGNTHHISTLGAELREGYGESIMDDNACRAAAKKVNSPYTNISDGIERIVPLMGLLNEGLYLIGDFELVPVRPDGTHALNSGSTESYYSVYRTEGTMSRHYDAPMYILPSQRAELLNPERIRYYMDVFQQLPPHQTPRAVAMYINGAVTLLLDGHHKAAAAAALGRRIKTSVIFSVKESKVLNEAIQNGEKLELCHSRWDYERDCFSGIGGVGLQICDEQLHTLSEVYRLCDLPISENEYAPLPRENFPAWGNVPDEFCQQLKSYPSRNTLREGTKIPPDKIKQCMQKIMDTPWQFWPCEYAAELIAYNELFPESSMLTEKNRERLIKESLK